MAETPLLQTLLADHPQLVRIARRIVKCPMRAEDVVQDVAVKLCQDCPIARLHNPHGYLRRMVRNLALDNARQMARERNATEAEPAWDEIASHCPAADRLMESCEALQAAVAALDRVPERTRGAFLSHRVDGVPQKDIARRLGVSPTLVNFMVRDATKLCRQAVDNL